MRKQDRDNISLAAMTGAGATAGGSLGVKALDMIPQSYKNKILAKLIEDRPLIIGSFMGPELAAGSGEARMALNMVRMLRKKGINARVGIGGGGELQIGPYSQYNTEAFRDSFKSRAEPWFSPTQLLHGSKIDHNDLLKLNSLKMPSGSLKAGDFLLKRMLDVSGKEGKEWLSSHSIAEQNKIFHELLSGERKALGIERFDKALSSIRSGAWDSFAPGRLATLLKLDNSLSPILDDGPGMFMLPGELRDRLHSGRAAGFMSTERGFKDWSSASLYRMPTIKTPVAILEKVIKRLPVSENLKNRMLTQLVSKTSGISATAARDLITAMKSHGIDLTLPSLGLITQTGAYEQLLSPHVGPNTGVKNLGLLYNFKANYLPGIGDAYIPGANIGDPPSTLEELKARRSAGRKAMFGEINRLRSLEGLAPIKDTNKVVFLSGGSVGPNGTQKLIDMLEATKGMDNVHVFSQIGGNQEFLDMVQNNAAFKSRIAGKTPAQVSEYIKSLDGQGRYINDLRYAYADLAKKYPGRFTITSRMSKSMLDNVISGANLYAPYGGSSSAQEATAFLTPQLFTTDDALNKGNLDFILEKMNNKNLSGSLDNTSTAIRRLIKQDKTLRKMFKEDGNKLTDRTKAYLTGNYRIGLFDRYSGANGTGNNSFIQIARDAIRAKKENAAKIRGMLSDNTLDEALSQNNLNRVTSLVKDQRDASNRFVNFAKSLVSDDVVTRTDKGLKFGFGLQGLKNGLKGSYLRLGRALSNGPVNSRFAPILAGAGILGGGAASYLLGKKVLDK